MYERRAIMKRWLIALWALGGIFFLIGRHCGVSRPLPIRHRQLRGQHFTMGCTHHLGSGQRVLRRLSRISSEILTEDRGPVLVFGTASKLLPVVLGPLFAMGFFRKPKNSALPILWLVLFFRR